MISLIFAAPSFAAAFQLSDPQSGAVTYGGQTIIAKEGFDLSARETGDIATGIDQLLHADAKSTFAPAAANWKGAIAYGQTSEHLPWTREVATQNDVAEISTAMIIPPDLRGDDQEYARFKWYFPIELLHGAHFVAPFGRHQSTSPPKSGVLTGQEENGKLIIVGAQQIQFSGGKVDFTIDLSPTGPWGLFQEDPASAYKGHLSREGNYYVLAVPTHGARWGAKIVHKLVLHAGTLDLAKLHPISSVHYQWHMPATWRIQFTSATPVTGFSIGKNLPGYEEFIAWNDGIYEDKTGLGWSSLPAGKLVAATPDANFGPLFSEGFAGNGPASFQLKHQNAEVLVNLLFSGAQENYQFQVRCNSGEWNAFSVPAAERRTITIPTYINNGKIQLDIKGQHWLFSGIVVQPLFFESEDYLFSRCWWAFGKSPWKWPEFKESTLWRSWPDDGFGPNELPQKITVIPQ